MTSTPDASRSRMKRRTVFLFALSLGVTVIAAHIASTWKYHGERSMERLARLMGGIPY